jgi:hypothetical protein
VLQKRWAMRVRRIDEETFEVKLEGPPATTHVVRLSAADYERLSRGAVTREDLVRLSFQFLLERENNTSILRSFDLPIIGRYFPEYEEEIRKRLQ